MEVEQNRSNDCEDNKGISDKIFKIEQLLCAVHAATVRHVALFNIDMFQLRFSMFKSFSIRKVQFPHPFIHIKCQFDTSICIWHEHIC